MRLLTRNEQHLLIGFLSVLTFPVLYIFRQSDTNSLVRWGWTFGPENFGWVFLLLLGAMAALVVFFVWLRGGGSVHYLLWGAVPVISILTFRQPEMIIDAGRYFIQAKYLALRGPLYFLNHWGGEIPAWTDLPLIPFIQGVIFRYIGEERILIQVFNLMVFGGAFYLLFLLAERLFGEEAGICSAGLILGSPYLLSQAPLMLVDIPSMFLFLLSLYLTVLAMERERVYLTVLAGLALFLFLLSKYTAIPVLTLFLFLPFLKKSGLKRRSTTLMTVFATTGILLLPLFLERQALVLKQISLLHDYQMKKLGSWEEGHISTFFFQIHPFVTLLAAYGIIAGLRERRRETLVMLFFPLFLLLLDLHRIRYMIPLLPIFFLSAGFGMKRLLDDRGVRAHLLFAIVISSLLVYFMGYLPFLKTTSMNNLMEAGRYIDGLPADGIRVDFLPQSGSVGNTAIAIPLLDLYTKKGLCNGQPWNEPPSRTHRESSLRFTWEMRRPYFYDCSGVPGYRLVISDSPTALSEMTIPFSGIKKSFTSRSGVFRFRTMVTLLEEPL